MSATPFKLAIAALGGQGGAVLTGWLVEIAEENGYWVQTTSVPGVAQRTGATLYYLEFFARTAVNGEAREPVMALMPVAGDVDCVVAAELLEAGRSIARGLVTPERTMLIASSHRDFTIGERSAMGRPVANESELIELAQLHARGFILFDMAAMAARHESVISAVLLGAIAGSAVLPFAKDAFEAAIRKGGLAVKTNLAAFEDAYNAAAAGTVDKPVPSAPRRLSGDIPSHARSPDLQDLLSRVKELPVAVQPVALEGVRRLIDYQDPPYAKLYLDRLERIAELEKRNAGGAEAHSLTKITAANLALWMSFEDTIRVADLKTRPSRNAELRSEVRAAPGQLIDVTEFMKPRVTEITGTLPANLGERLQHSAAASKFLARFTNGKRVRSTTITGFLLLRAVARLQRWRRGTLRYKTENARIGAWLAHIERLAASHRELAVEVARAQRLIKGYGDTHERGWRNFSSLMDELAVLQNSTNGAAILARLQEAALADEAGVGLAHELSAIKRAHEPAAQVGERQVQNTIGEAHL